MLLRVALLGMAAVRGADAHAAYMLQAAKCARSLDVGATIMGSAVAASTAKLITVSGLTAGGTYTAGATATVSLSGGGTGVLEVVGATFSTGTRGCTDLRTTDTTGADITLPASGAVTVRAVWAAAYGTVSAATEFTLTGAIDPCASVTCTASDACHVAGTCSADGTCSAETNAADGTSCDDGDATTTSDVCTVRAVTTATLRRAATSAPPVRALASRSRRSS